MSLDRLLYDHRKMTWISERRRFLNPSPPTPTPPDDPARLPSACALERIVEEAKYVEELMQVHRQDLEEVLTTEEWQVMQESVRRFRDGYRAYSEALADKKKGKDEALGRLMIDSATVAALDGFINGLIYCSVRELNLSRTGPKASKLKFAPGAPADQAGKVAIAPQAAGAHT